MTKPFRVLGLQQIANGGLDNCLLRTLWCDIFGPEIKGQPRSAPENIDDDIRTLGLDQQAVELALIQPIDRYGRAGARTTTVNHIGLWVDDLDKAVEWMAVHSVRFAPGGIRKDDAGRDTCFIRAKTSAEFPVAGEGALIELVQAPDDVVATLSIL
jgi:lactoylglutathione lyase